MFRWKTPLGADDALKHSKHNQKTHGRRYASVTGQTAMDVARGQGMDEKAARRFAATAMDVMRSAPLDARPIPQSDAEAKALNLELWKKMNRDDYTYEEGLAMVMYTNGLSFDINKVLRGRATPDQVDKDIDQLTPLFNNKDRVPENMTVLRGMELSPEDFAKFQKGAVLSDPAFMSTSIRRETVDFYARTGSGGEQWSVEGREKVVMTMRVPAGAKAMYANSLIWDHDTKELIRKGRDPKKRWQDFPHIEKGEMVFAPNTKYIVRSMEQRDGVWYVDAEILPED